MRDFYLREGNYLRDMEGIVLPYLDERRCESDFSGYDGNPIHYVAYLADEPRASVIVSHGFTESAEKYHELSYYLLKEGYNVFLPEHRGHGRSFRAVPDSTLTHIDRFSEYTRDFFAFSRRVREVAKEDVYLFAHSMGGAIGTLVMEEDPTLFRAAVLSSPMVMPKSGHVPAAFGRVLTWFFCLFGQGKKRAFISGEYPGYEEFEDSCKTSKERFAEYEEIREKTPLFQNYGPSYRWVYESLKVKRKILRRGAPESIKARALMFLAGEDTMVREDAARTLAARIPDCKVILCKKAKHEIFGSEDATVLPYFEEILDFYDHASRAEPKPC